MKQMKLYTMFLTEKGELVCVIPTMDTSFPTQSKILYDGGKHALFYRTSNQIFILDYVNKAIQTVLKLQQQNVVTNYFVPIISTEHLPSFELE